MATGQAGDDIFNSTQINPDLDDPEQLTGDSIQSFLTLVVQLQWLVALGRLVTHAQVTTLSKLKLTQKKLHDLWWHHLDLKTNIYGYIHIFQINGLSTTPHVSFVGSPQVPFLMCTLEIPQKLQHKFFALNFGYLYF